MKANLTEIMESVQGEGLLLGTRQIFIRFSGCNLRCNYCDTIGSFENSTHCAISKQTGNRKLCEKAINPVSIQQVVGYLENYSSSWISLTGGEPLLRPEYIKELGIILKSLNYKILLETNGTLFEELEMCLPYIDMISMDFKLPTATGTDCWDKHRRFLSAIGDKPAYIKIVIDTNVKEEEIVQAVDIISSNKRAYTLVLQPASPYGSSFAPDMMKLLDYQRICLQRLKDVRIIPQIHSYLGII